MTRNNKLTCGWCGASSNVKLRRSVLSVVATYSLLDAPHGLRGVLVHFTRTGVHPRARRWCFRYTIICHQLRKRTPGVYLDIATQGQKLHSGWEKWRKKNSPSEWKSVLRENGIAPPSIVCLFEEQPWPWFQVIRIDCDVGDDDDDSDDGGDGNDGL